jgi:hypothetical protein
LTIESPPYKTGFLLYEEGIRLVNRLKSIIMFNHLFVKKGSFGTILGSISQYEWNSQDDPSELPEGDSETADG